MKFALVIVFLLSTVPIFAQSKPVTPIFSEAEQTQIERERTPDLPKLNELLRTADRVVVVFTEGENERKTFESAKESDLIELREALKVTVPDEWRMAVCASPYIHFYRGDQKLMSIGYASGPFVTTTLWSGDVMLADLEKWFAWFDKRGMPELHAEFEKQRLAAIEFEKAERRWNEAMPRGIKEPYERELSNFGLPSMGDVSAFKPILEREYPNKRERILAVLHWFGSGQGPWNGHPSYETIAENILFSFTTAELLDAMQSRKLTLTETEGAARLLAGWDFLQQRPEDLALIPAKMKKQLHDHSLKIAIAENRERAAKAFGGR